VTYRIRWSSAARRAIETTLPEAVATAVWELVNGALAESPYRVGKPLVRELAGLWSAQRGQYRVIYVINDATVTVTIVAVSHRRDVYR
jgi:mRNA-degrading endonuclease RelE of RelBE toxin-antitoxin system